MAEFVKQRARIIIGQQAGIALGEIAHIDHDGAHIPAKLALAAHRRTPRARAFRSPRKVVTHENRNMASPARHLPSTRIRVIQRHIQRAEFQPEKPRGAIKGRRDHRIELEIRLQLRLIQIMLGQPPLLRIITPIPWRQRIIDPVIMQHPGQPRGISIGLRARRFPNRHEQIAHRLRVACHLGL